MESPEDKAKRKFSKHLLNPIWTYQYSVFYEEPEQSRNLLEDQRVFRQELRRKFADQPFLIRIQTLNRDNVLQAYLTLYTTQKAFGLTELAERYYPAPVNVIYRRLSATQRELKARRILEQKPHDLTKLFGSVRIKRYALINKRLLTDVDD